MPGTIVKSHFHTLTQAEEFIDQQIDRYVELNAEDALPWTLVHNHKEKTFYLSFDHPRHAPHEATYEIDNLHEFNPDTNWGCF